MRKILYKQIVLLLMVTVIISPIAGCSTNSTDNKDIDTKSVKVEDDVTKANVNSEIAKEVKKYFKDTKFQGSTFQGAALVAINGDIIFADGYGFADEDTQSKITKNTSFEIASITKQFTAAAIMQLVEQGKLSVDDTLDKYFPEYPLGSKITIKNLLQMRSGIYDYMDDPAFYQYNEKTDGALEEFHNKITKQINQGVKDKNLQETGLKQLYKLDFKFEPDSKFSYSNTNYYLLGLIIEQLSGMSYQDYITKYMFEVCGIEGNLKYRGSDAKGVCEDDYVDPVEYTFSAGSINASVMDLYKWNEALFGGKIVTKESLKEMTTAVGGYGYGLMVDDVAKSIYHLGSLYPFLSYNLYNTKSKVQIIVLTNNCEKINTELIGSTLFSRVNSLLGN